MNNNQLKMIACITMAIDHIGVILFPEIRLFRMIGRISLPVFAFFIAEGCRHTHDRKRYFLNIFLLSLFCQVFAVGEQIVNGNFAGLYLNILCTFSLSVIVCFAFLSRKPVYIVLGMVLLLLLTVGLGQITAFPITFDYGIAGAILPVFALCEDRKKRLYYFIPGLILFNLLYYPHMNCTWWSMLAVPFLVLYNGERGNRRFKYWFYIFYPAHLAVIYGISELFYFG